MGVPQACRKCSLSTIVPWIHFEVTNVCAEKEAPCERKWVNKHVHVCRAANTYAYAPVNKPRAANAYAYFCVSQWTQSSMPPPPLLHMCPFSLTFVPSFHFCMSITFHACSAQLHLTTSQHSPLSIRCWSRSEGGGRPWGRWGCWWPARPVAWAKRWPYSSHAKATRSSSRAATRSASGKLPTIAKVLHVDLSLTLSSSSAVRLKYSHSPIRDKPRSTRCCATFRNPR